MKKFAILMTVFLAQAAFAGMTHVEKGEVREDSREKEVIANSARVNDKADANRSVIVDDIRVQADARYVEKLSSADKREVAKRDTGAMNGLIKAEDSSELTPAERSSVQSFVSKLRAKSVAMKSGDAHAVLEETARENNLDAERIRKDCDGI